MTFVVFFAAYSTRDSNNSNTFAQLQEIADQKLEIVTTWLRAERGKRLQNVALAFSIVPIDR